VVGRILDTDHLILLDGGLELAVESLDRLEDLLGGGRGVTKKEVVLVGDETASFLDLLLRGLDNVVGSIVGV